MKKQAKKVSQEKIAELLEAAKAVINDAKNHSDFAREYHVKRSLMEELEAALKNAAI